MRQKSFTQSDNTRADFKGANQKISIKWLATAILLLAALSLATTAQAQRFRSDSLTIAYSATGTTTASTVYFGKGGTPTFSGSIAAGVDPFNNSGTLAISSVGANINPVGSTVVVRSAHFYYRVYLQGTTPANQPTFVRVNLDAPATSTSEKVIYGSSQPIDLLTMPRATGGGTYVVEIYYDFTYTDGSDSGTVNDQANGPAAPYTATFTVIAPANTPTGATTTWQSTSSTAWFTASNWSNGVPTGTSDAIIPENTQGTNIVFPVLNNPARNYRVRNLTLDGTTNSGRAQLTIQNAVLHVYGNIQQLSGGLVGTDIGTAGVLDSTKNSTLYLRGANQFITGRLSVPDVIVSGTDIKSIANALLPTNILAFLPTTSSGVIVQTASARQNQDGTTTYVFDTTGNSVVNLGSTGAISKELIGRETNVSYIKGITTTARPLRTGVSQTFGNIGLDLMPNHDAPLLTIQRIIGDPLLGPTVPNPRTTPVPVKRQYNISGDDNSANVGTAGSSNNVVFHYLDSDYELNGIMESNLTMFRTPTGGSPYTPVQGNLNQTDNTVTRAALPSLPNYYLTLGDRTNPLPVSLSAFTATRTGSNAALAWTTSSEQNNAGFEVQVSSNGVEFRKLAFVASKSPNSVQTQSYSYVDAEANKSGIRYYRLRQVDITGEAAYSPVRALNLDGATTTTDALVAYPNPFVDKLDFNLDAAKLGDGKARVQLVDMAGRTVREQTLSVSNASVTLAGLDGLRSGLYLAKITLPDGSTKTVRIQKQ